MNSSDRRRFPRYETKVDVKILTMDSEVKGTMIDISYGGICITSQKAIKPGTKVNILFKLKRTYTIQGTIIWSLIVYEGEESYYRMGIKTSRIVPEDIIAGEFPEKAALMTQILSQIK